MWECGVTQISAVGFGMQMVGTKLRKGGRFYWGRVWLKSLRPHTNAAVEETWRGMGGYGEHLSKEQVAELVAPSLDTLELVNSWLKHHGVSPTSISRTHGGGWLTVSSVPVSRANEMLGVLYWHAGTNDNFPHVLYAHVQTIAPMTRTHFASMPVLCCSRPHAPASMEKRHVLSRCDVRVTPVFLRVLYGTVKYEPAATGRNVLGVTGYLGQYPSPSDLVEQVNGGGNNRNDRTPVTRRISTFNHPGNNVSSPARLLQLRWLTAVQTRWQLVNELERAVPRVDYLHNLQGPIPLTIATSYGGNEQTVPEQSVRPPWHQYSFRKRRRCCGGGDYMATTTRAKTASSPSSPHPVPGSLVSAVRGARPKTGASFCGGFSNYFRAMSTRWHSESLPRKLGDMYKARTSLGAAASPHSRPTIRSSFAGDLWLCKDPLDFLKPWLYGKRPGLNDILRMARTRAARLMGSLP
ncbi:hypothetical protein EDB89DRAFT_2243082 [Lactarius sanguifluus]|nr:hypothetical protein EDB89DRAFT_2243082 [Lactarius sanguifluus]